ncbi:toll-like receptor 4 isoform X1 [Haliotis rubra]|uniref:toll-like receptor 4 isoform X1 n=2 Tax=Haliotis rubra TaxID=36100 RepID=UPI001EE523BB|nr:toll-like receptor 4 isoform X1 [Haliotis rubra]
MELVRNLLVLVLLLELRVSNNVITSMQAASRDARYVATDNASNDERPGVRNSASQNTRNNADQDTSDDAHQHVNQDQCVPCKCHYDGERVIADCRNRTLEKVPSHLLSNITDLNLSVNHIRRLENGSLSYAHLTRLDVSFNRLKDIELGAFQELRNLEVLNLTHNRLSPTKVYRDGLFKRQAKLKVLHINQNVESRPYDESLNRRVESRSLKDSPNSSFIEKDIHHMHFGNHFGRDAYPGPAFKYLISLQDLRIDGPKELYFGKGFTLKQLQSLSLGGRFRTCYTRYLRNDTFEDVPHLQTLDVSYCLLIDIEISSFEVLKNLTSLLMSHNRYLGITKMGQATYGLQNSSLRTLNVNRIGQIMGRSTLLTVEDVKYLKNTKLEELYIEANRIEIIDKNVMSNLPTSLKKISIKENNLSFGLYLMELSVLTDLKWVDASHQDTSIISFFDTTSLHSRRLLQLDKYNKPIRGNVTIYVPPNVTFINASHSKMAFEVLRFQIGENKIREIDLSFNYFTLWTGPIIGLTHLEKVHVSNNFCEHLAEGVFSYFPSLKYLDISSNYLGYTLTNDTFSEMPLLEYLDLSNNKISSLPKLIFKNSSRLEFLKLGSNYMMSWNIDIINFNMTSINLSRNAFDEIPSLLRHQVRCMVRHDFQLHFNDNPLKCNCLTLNSLKWMIDNSFKLPGLDKMICVDDSNRQLFLKDIHQIVFDLDKKCTSYLGLSIGVLCLVMLVLSLSTTGIGYRFRWKLRYLYYLVRIKHRGYLAAEEEEDGGPQFEFDAFISYADEDRGFVVEDMRRILEGQHGLRLCIHHRDFLVGEAIAANILHAIRSSRRTVIILSRNFLKSYWCKYEVEMAKMESIYTGRNTLLVVILEKIPVKNLPPNIVELMRQDSYLEYTDDREGQEVFWESLQRAVHTA